MNVFKSSAVDVYVGKTKWKTLWQKEKLHVLCNFFFCHYVFKSSAVDVYVGKTKLFSTCRPILKTQRQQIILENILTIHRRYCSQCNFAFCHTDFQLYSIIRLSFIEIFYIKWFIIVTCVNNLKQTFII